jgi:HEAT repeat protein
LFCHKSMSNENQKLKLEAVLSALTDKAQLFPSELLPFFSDITSNDLEEVKKIWPKISLERRISLLSELEDMMEEDTLLCCDNFAKFALQDDFPEVRVAAISLLEECDEPRLAKVYIDMLENDESEIAQIAAADALGKYVLLGELDEIPQATAEQSIKALTSKLKSKPAKEIEQELLKSLSYSSNPEIRRMIEKAFLNPDKSWKLTAIISMGRSADEHWEKSILQMIRSEDPDFQREAVKAAGELSLSSARELLIQILDTEEDDIELRINSIRSLSKIGGGNVKSVLEHIMEETVDDEEAQAIETALEELDFYSELPDLDI